jgi:hypothetical protein
VNLHSFAAGRVTKKYSGRRKYCTPFSNLRVP